MTSPIRASDVFEKMNGFSIIGEFHVSSLERVIIGYRELATLSDRGTPVCEFVTARCAPRCDSPREWYWGNYFTSNSTAQNRRNAFADFVKRCDMDSSS